MGATNEELLNSIRYYQRSLDKYTSFGNAYKLIGIIEKLKRLPIATSHLEETGIGRTVNALRKLGGEVGDAAKGLVVSWKEMVVQEEGKVQKTAEESPNEACVSANDNDCYEEKENSCKEEEVEDSRYLEKESTSSHRLSDTEKKSSEKHEKVKNSYSSNNGSGSSHEKKNKHGGTDNSSKKRRKSNSSNDEHDSKRHHDSSGFESDEEIYDKNHSKSSSKRNKESESSENEEENWKHKSKKSKHSKDSSDSEDSYRKHKSSKSSRDDSSSKSKSREKTESKKREYDSSSDREADKSKSKHRSHSKSKRESDCEEDRSSSKHKSKKNCESSSDNDEAKHKSKHNSKSRHDKDSSKSRESKSHSSRSDKHEKKDKKESKPDESKEKHGHKKSESRTHDEKHKKSKEEKETGKKQKSSSSSKQEESSKPSSSNSKHKSSSDKKKDKVKSTPVYTEKIMNGIDSGSGASFAEALGMCGPMVSKAATSSSSSSKKKSSSLPVYEKPRSSSSYVRPEKTETIEEDVVPNLLREQPPEPININISSLLPDITPNYRPLGFPIDSQPKRMLSHDEALSQVISNKNMRTKVYSGNKSFGKVDTLFDMCVRILQDNIDALEYTGGVPFLILKPVLERATPDQLFNMEHHNPYLIEDTDDLWQLHCQKEFRNKKREELESWREMYMRCLNEREARLNAITANIKQSQDKSTPVRTTKLAYIDSEVKPPRNVARKQAKNGITFDKKPAQTPASRVAALSSHGEAGKVAVPNPGSRAAEQRSSGSAAAVKPKKAPLMAKTLSFLKNRFRR